MKLEALRKIIKENLRATIEEAEATIDKKELIKDLEKWADEHGRIPEDNLRDVAVEFGLDIDSDEIISAQIAVLDKVQTERQEELTYDIKDVLDTEFPGEAPSFDEFYKVFQGYNFDNNYSLVDDKVREKFTQLTTNPNQLKLDI